MIKTFIAGQTLNAGGGHWAS